MNNHDGGNNENNTNNIDIMTIAVSTVMAMVIIQYLFVCMLTQELNGQVQNRQEDKKMTLIHIKKQRSNMNKTQDGTKAKSCNSVNDK